MSAPMTPDDYTGATLGQGTLSYETMPTRIDRAPTTYTVEKFYVGARSDFYRVDCLSTSGDPATVAVHRKSSNIRCSTCGTANQCAHVAALREWMADQPEVAA